MKKIFVVFISIISLIVLCVSCGNGSGFLEYLNKMDEERPFSNHLVQEENISMIKEYITQREGSDFKELYGIPFKVFLISQDSEKKQYSVIFDTETEFGSKGLLRMRVIGNMDKEHAMKLDELKWYYIKGKGLYFKDENGNRTSELTLFYLDGVSFIIHPIPALYFEEIVPVVVD